MFKRVGIMQLGLGIVVALCATASTASDCTGIHDISGSETLGSDYATTSATNPCMRFTAANASLNCDGYSLICRRLRHRRSRRTERRDHTQLQDSQRHR